MADGVLKKGVDSGALTDDARAEREFQSTPAFSGEGTTQAPEGPDQQGRFNPPPPFQAREPEDTEDLILRAPVSIHPRLFRRGNTRIVAGFPPEEMFQSTPAFSGEGT